MTLTSFPNDKYEALTMLYLQHQEISTLTPEELAKKYADVHASIKNSLSTGKKQQVRT